jgi:hypothetical protein
MVQRSPDVAKAVEFEVEYALAAKLKGKVAEVEIAAAARAVIEQLQRTDWDIRSRGGCNELSHSALSLVSQAPPLSRARAG